MKKLVSLFLCCVLFIMPVQITFADEPLPDEWYELEGIDGPAINIQDENGIAPYTKYIMLVNTYISKLESNKIGMRVEVYCTEEMKSISTTFYLQKSNDGAWKDVASGSVSTSDSHTMYKNVSASNVSSGTYRAKTVTLVTDQYGYSESLTGYSGSITI